MMRFRPRFTVRTLAIFVTLVCAYFGAWEATKRYGIPGSKLKSKYVKSGSAPGPCLIVLDVLEPGERDNTQWGCVIEFERVRNYHLWLFGRTIKVPFESEWK